jgi:hypothetical protein
MDTRGLGCDWMTAEPDIALLMALECVLRVLYIDACACS